MTFTEAAVQVLRLVGKPLHYKEITDVAIEKDLLSHVGKSPEVTMGARLAAVVKKAAEDSLLGRVKPGVFCLTEWDEATIEQGLADRTPALKRIARIEAERAKAAERAAAETQPGTEDAEQAAAAEEEGSSSADGGQGEAAEQPSPSETAVEAPPAEGSLSAPALGELDGEELGEDERARAELTAAATSIFEEEDDDDEPILGGEDPPSDEGDSRRGRRRRRRRGGRDRDDDDLPSYTVSDAGGDTSAASDSSERREPREGREAREGREPREGREAREGREPREGREAREGREPREGREARESRDAREGRRERLKLEESAGEELADAIANQLGGFRRQGSASFKQLTDSNGGRSRGRGRSAGGDSSAVQMAAAAVRADNLRRESAGQRPRFRLLTNGRVALSDWAADKELLKLEDEIHELVAKHKEASLKLLQKRLVELPSKACGELCLTLLEKAGYGRLSVVRRQGSHASELHLSGTFAGPAGDLPVAIVVRRDGKDVGRERVTDLRGSLHHYEQASFGVIVSTGQVLSGAREEAAASGATPVHFVDGARLAALCQLNGIAVVTEHLSLATPDLELLDALRSS